MHLWVEACNTAAYVQNRCPHRVLGMSTPEEAFTGKKLDIYHLNSFGSYVYIHVAKDARKNPKPSAEVGIFVGYTETPHNYRVYFSDSQMTVVRWDIKFNEVKSINLSLERELHGQITKLGNSFWRVARIREKFLISRPRKKSTKFLGQEF